MPTNDELQQQLIKDLLIESADGLDRFDREMLALENGQGNPETLNVVFRVIHTIKGTAGCLGLSKIESVAHVGENLLDALRGGKITLHKEMITTLLSYADALRQMLKSIEDTGSEGSADFSALLQKLQDLQTAQKAPSTPPASIPETPTTEGAERATESTAANKGWGLFDDAPTEAQTPIPAPVATSPSPALANSAAPAAAPAPVNPSHPAPDATAERDPAAKTTSVSDSAIRVSVDQLDKLMNLVGELVLARNQIVQYSGVVQENSLIAASQRLNIITTELQESVMKTRMQPIGNVWTKFPRVVRDVAHELGKKVQLVMQGNETELDRTIIEAIKDPLTHIVRNAIDHGIETPETRSVAGKPAEGTLLLRAFHEGGQVNIEIMDDGRGINVSKVKEKALQRMLITADQASRMSERETFNLIFLPGFSTAEKITNVSGRGVGMDVVKTNIEKIGGSVDVLSEPNNGTTIKIKIPLTLAIIPALVVTSGGERFAIPQVSLLELVRLESEQARKGIEMLYGSPIYRLRGQLLPLCYLNRELDIDAGATGSRADNGASQSSSDAVNIVVLQADGRQFGLVVDEINDTEEIVVKPLGKQLKGITCFAGATIMGDGRVALILDVLGLAQHANVINEVRDRSMVDKTKSDNRLTNKQTLLLFEIGKGSRMAIPLSMVARLEEFPRSQIEQSGTQKVVQYRGQILPLIAVADYVNTRGEAFTEDQDMVQVVVYSEQGRSVGLIVGAISDIVEESITVKRDVQGSGILGSVVIQDKVTDLLDVSTIIQSADPSFYTSKPDLEMAA
ncbi:MAG: chemotaxis protein CheW [Verrucomicrobiales bacterium]|nr:chemotaxis protein CheW [Verrucomicrobiales bacterium]